MTSTESGEYTYGYPRPALAVDIAVLTVVPGDPIPRLGVLVLSRQTEHLRGVWDIPGSFVRDGERVREAVHRTLKEKAGVTGFEPELRTLFDEPGRDERGWVVAAAFSAAVPHTDLQEAIADREDVVIAEVADPAVHPVSLSLPDDQQELPFDHQKIVDDAVRALQARYDLGLQDGGRPRADPGNLMTQEPFTLTDLRQIYEAVHGHPIQRDSFARRFDPRLGGSTLRAARGRRSTRGRPARLFAKLDQTTDD